jgi:DtxR family Mn-dependent transcriptional regulator
MKTETQQDYLKAIYQLGEAHPAGTVSTSRLAAHLGLADASVTGMLKRLAAADPQLVAYEPYAGARLTPAGQKAALETIRHHRLIESFLNQVLGYRWDEVHAEAERLEHAISEEMEERMAAALGHPLADPHGDPIPDRDGRLHAPDYITLTDLPAGLPATVGRITGQTPELLRYLAELGLVPAARLRVTARGPFNGPVTLTVEGGTGVALSREITDRVLVLPAESAEEVRHADK